jgi:peptidyl-prolyl cis-trans isomerase C
MKSHESSYPVFVMKLLGGLLWTALLGLASCGDSSSTLPEDVLARSGGEVLTVAAFADAMSRRGVRTEGAREALLEEMLLDLRILHAARLAGLEKDPEIVAAHRALLISTYRQQQGLLTPSSAEVSEEEMQQYFNDHPQEFQIPSRIRVAMIFVAVPEMGGPRSRKKARERITQVREEAQKIVHSTESPHFGHLAANYSDHQSSRYQGGDLGFVSPVDERLPNSVFEATISLEPNSLSEIIETDEGFYLTRLIEKTIASTLPYQQAAPTIRTKLQTAANQKREDTFARSMQSLPVTVERSRATALPLPTAVAASPSGPSGPTLFRPDETGS